MKVSITSLEDLTIEDLTEIQRFLERLYGVSFELTLKRNVVLLESGK